MNQQLQHLRKSEKLSLQVSVPLMKITALISYSFYIFTLNQHIKWVKTGIQSRRRKIILQEPQNKVHLPYLEANYEAGACKTRWRAWVIKQWCWKMLQERVRNASKLLVHIKELPGFCPPSPVFNCSSHISR